MRSGFAVTTAAFVFLATRAFAQTVPPEIAKQGAEVYQAHCAMCHEHPQGRTPGRPGLTVTRSPDYVLRVLTSGVMRQQASALSDDEKKAVAAYLFGRMPGSTSGIDLAANRCKTPPAPLSLRGSLWNGWSGWGATNVRYQPNPGLKAADVPKLKLKWSFAYPGGTSSQPTIVGGRIFVPSMAGVVYSLDAATGCTYWATDIGAPVRTAISVGKLPSGGFAAYLGNGRGEAIALDAESGKELWRTRVEDHSMVRLTGAPTLFEGRLYVPVSSFEENVGDDPTYPCCTFRGSVAALDSATGRLIWKAYTIPEAPKPLGDGHHLGPAGASVWSSPTIDAKRRLIYVGTGNAYTAPAAATSDSVVAFDLDTGAMRWSSQLHHSDSFLVGCGPKSRTRANCPKGDLGPDFDLGSSPLLVTTPDGKDHLIATTKAGAAFGLDVDHKGKILWQARIGQGGLLGGIEWGAASDGRRVYATVSDIGVAGEGAGDDGSSMPMPGISALSPVSGKVFWRVPSPKVPCSWEGACQQALFAAPTVIPGVVFSGSFDGHERAFSVTDGHMVWDIDTGHSFDAVNGEKAHGGSIDQGGQTVADGTLFLNSGARNGQPGNALLAFTVDGK